MKAILYHVRPDAACPECRTSGVFVLAHELTHTDELLRKRCSPLSTNLDQLSCMSGLLSGIKIDVRTLYKMSGT